MIMFILYTVSSNFNFLMFSDMQIYRPIGSLPNQIRLPITTWYNVGTKRFMNFPSTIHKDITTKGMAKYNPNAMIERFFF